MKPTHDSERLLSNEFPGGEPRDHGFLAVRRNDREFSSAGPKIEDGISRVTLQKEDLLWRQVDEF
jgi:hypothetical protein